VKNASRTDGSKLQCSNTDRHCKLATEEIIIPILPTNFPQTGVSAQNFEFFDANFPARIKFFDSQKFGLDNLSLRPPAEKPLNCGLFIQHLKQGVTQNYSFGKASDASCGGVSFRGKRCGSGGCVISGVQGQNSWSGGHGSETSLKLKHFWLLDVQRIPQICYLF